MAFLTLQLTSSESTFEYYDFPKEFLDKSYEIGVIRIDGNLEIIYRTIRINDKNDKFIYTYSGISNNNLEEYVIDIPHGMYSFPKLIETIKESLIRRDRDFFKATVKKNEIHFEICKSYTIK